MNGKDETTNWLALAKEQAQRPGKVHGDWAMVYAQISIAEDLHELVEYVARLDQGQRDQLDQISKDLQSIRRAMPPSEGFSATASKF